MRGFAALLFWYTSWFEELKKRRVFELKKALEKSEDSIGSLESKLEALKAKKTCSNLDCSFNHANSTMQFRKFEGDEYFRNEMSKDGLSAGSFTEETQAIPSIHCQLKVNVLEDEFGTQPSVSDTLQGDNFPCVVKLSDALHLDCGFSIRRKRGERKRKGWDVKEACVRENDMMGSDNAEAKDKVQLASGCGPLYVENSSKSDDQAQCSRHEEGLNSLILVLNAVLEDEQVSIFQRRMDGQKRARYKKLIRRHMDFDTIRSRIANKSITEARELFRDLLLLANNALVFYSKSTREYKCGLALQKLISRKLRQHEESIGNKVRRTFGKSVVHTIPVKHRIARPFSNGISNKFDNGASDVVVEMSMSKQAKGGPGRSGKVGRGSVAVKAKASAKTRKRPRTAN